MAPARVVAEGDEVQAPGELAGHEGERLGVGQQPGEVGGGAAEAAGEGVAQGGLGQETEAHQLAAEDLAAAALLAEGDVELVLADQPQLEEGLSDGRGGGRHGGGSWACKACRRVSQRWRGKRAGCRSASRRACR